MRSAETIDQRFLRTATGVAVPAHTETDRSVLAHPIPSRGGNPHVHDHHLWTEENHIELDDVDELDRAKRPWALLMYGSLAAMLVLWLVMIARS